MSDRYSNVLHNPQTGHAEFQRAWMWAKGMLVAGHKLSVDIRRATRSEAANRLLHATIAEIAEQLEWAGKKRTPEVWKRLLVAAWLRARGEHVEILPALDGHGVDIVFERTSQLSRAECSELQEFVFSWGSENGVKFPAPEYAQCSN